MPQFASRINGANSFGLETMTFYVGVARRAALLADPPLHLLVDRAGIGWVTWCTGAEGWEEDTAKQRRCKHCLRLAWQHLRDRPPGPAEKTDLDWFVGREP